MNKNFFSIVVHIIGWAIFLSLPLLFFSGRYGQPGVLKVFEAYEFWFYFLVYFGIFYLNYFVLLPRLYFGKQKIIYFGILLVLGAAVFLLSPFHKLVSINRPPFRDVPTLLFNERIIPNHFPGKSPIQEIHPDFRHINNPPPFAKAPDIVSLVLFLLVIVIGIMLQSSRRLINIEKKLLETSSEKSRAELAFLKAQINPHFLFNILNNIYSLAVVKHDDTAEAILKLSGIMRYVMTDDGSNSTVPLSDEIECITDYIYLQRLRLGEKANLDFNITGNPSGKYIAPLILITFVENVFKHGISKHEYSPLIINLRIDDDSLLFVTENKLFFKKQESGNAGLGILNSQKRLSLMYPDKYDLQISKNTGRFYVKLYLRLN